MVKELYLKTTTATHNSILDVFSALKFTGNFHRHYLIHIFLPKLLRTLGKEFRFNYMLKMFM